MSTYVLSNTISTLRSAMEAMECQSLPAERMQDLSASVMILIREMFACSSPEHFTNDELNLISNTLTMAFRNTMDAAHGPIDWDFEV
jgi:hypothetical protein